MQKVLGSLPSGTIDKKYTLSLLAIYIFVVLIRFNLSKMALLKWNKSFTNALCTCEKQSCIMSFIDCQTCPASLHISL